MQPLCKEKIQKGCQSPDGNNGNGSSHAHEREWAEGLIYCHSRMNANTNKILEVSSFAYALIELLIEKGMISLEDIDRKKPEVMERLKKKFSEKGMGVAVLSDDRDKYNLEEEAEVDCASRIHICRAACCRLSVALSRQDVEEGMVWWEPGQPYMIAKGDNQYCRHMDPDSFACTIYDYRPLACRAYNCKKDNRIWQDFDKEILNPDLEGIFKDKIVRKG